MVMSYDERHLDEGISREKTNDGFRYYYIATGADASQRDLNRINKLKIPPAWTDLWISRDANSSIQAIGKDSKGRKQYRYHDVHIQQAEKKKFARLYLFIKDRPKLDRRIAHDNNLPFYEKNRIIALMIQLIEDYNMRAGKEIYARQNKSYGISSLRKKHVKIDGRSITLDFKGKSKQRLHFTIVNDFYVDSIKMLMKLNGDNLFQYIMMDEDGHERIMNVTDRDLNQYLQTYMGAEFTIKDFRTYGANIAFIKALLSESKKRTPKNSKTIKKNIAQAIKSTARQLKHTGAVSKKSYIMNFAIELYQNSPEFFVARKHEDPTDLLLELLRMYKRYILREEHVT